MPVIRTRSVLSGLLVKEAMRRQVIDLPKSASLDKCIRHLIKFKVNGLLVTDEKQCPVGVVSKTDLVGAFYAGLPARSSLEDIMNGPLLTCFPDDELETALNLMRENRVHRLYVQGAERSSVIGVLSYLDVVALLYRYCRVCAKSMVRKSDGPDIADRAQPPSVQEIMTKPVVYCREKDSLAKVIEELTAHRLGAVLIQDDDGSARGVISKTDVILAYRRSTSLEVEARSIMQSPVVSSDLHCLLSDAIGHMFVNDVQRLFVHAGDPARIVGVMSLSDAAQIRSGSCRACLASRIIGAP